MQSLTLRSHGLSYEAKALSVDISKMCSMNLDLFIFRKESNKTH